MAESGTRAASSGQWGVTLRRDAWWVEVIPIILIMGGFSIYATWRAFEGHFYEWGPYLISFLFTFDRSPSSVVEACLPRC